MSSSCRQEQSPADAGYAMLSLRNILVLVAVGGLVWWVGHLGAKQGWGGAAGVRREDRGMMLIPLKLIQF